MMSHLPSRLKQLVELESHVCYRTPPSPGQMEFDYLPGSIPVLLSAPHGAAHTRNGRLKDEDDYTAGLALLLGQVTGAHVLYAHRQSGTDPNWYRWVPYKQRIQQILLRAPIHFVLDLHGSSPRREFGLALGTMRGQSCPGMRSLLVSSLQRSGFGLQSPVLRRLDIDQTFTAGGGVLQETVTRFVWETLHVPAAQIEINARLRVVRRLDPNTSPRSALRADPQAVEHTIDALAALICALEQLDGHWRAAGANG